MPELSDAMALPSPPPFEAVKEQLRSLIQTQKLQQHLADLQAKTKIENRVAPKPPVQEEAPPPASNESQSQGGQEAGKPEAPPAEPAPKPQSAPGTP